MGKSLFDMITSLGGRTHTRIYDICSGVNYNTTVDTELGDEDCSNVLEVNGEGKIIAVIPILTTNTSFYGQIKVFTDNSKLVAGKAYWYYQRLYPFIFGGNEFNSIVGYNRNFTDGAGNDVGIYLPEIGTLLCGTSFYKMPYRNNYTDFYVNPIHPIVYDDSSGSKEFTFKESFKILASQAGGSTHSGGSAKVLVIYDLYD